MNSACRTCLSLGELSPIFSDRKLHKNYSHVLFLTTGLKIELDDGLPQCICQGCTELINSALKLRNQSHSAQKILLENGPSKVQPDSGSHNEMNSYIDNTILPHEIDSAEQSDQVGICKNKIKIEIDLLEHLDLEESNSKNPLVKIEHESKSRYDKGSHCKANRKPVKNEPKEQEIANFIEDNEESQGYTVFSESIRVKIESDSETSKRKEIKVKRKNDRKRIAESGNDDTEGRVKRKHARKKVIDSQKVETEERVKRKYVRKSGQVRPVVAVKKGKRPTRQQVVDKYRPMMESQYVAGEPVKCNVCKRQYAHLYTFIRHIAKHMGVRYTCEDCGQQLSSPLKLKGHRMRKHGAERKLLCQHCDYRAVDQAQLNNHVHKMHTGLRPFVCDLCGADFYCKANIRQHMRKHKTIRNVQCDRCPAMFKSRSSLASHTAKCHRMNFAYICYLCPHRYKSRCSVRKHLTRCHGVPRHEQGPLTMYKWGKDEPLPPELADLIFSSRERAGSVKLEEATRASAVLQSLYAVDK